VGCGPGAAGRPHVLPQHADAERAAIRARALREAGGTVTGHASGAEGEGPRDVLADVLAVFGSDAGLQWADAAQRLASRFPQRWDCAGADAVDTECRALSIPATPPDTPRATPPHRGASGCERSADPEIAAIIRREQEPP
jgi:hypothetical protein